MFDPQPGVTSPAALRIAEAAGTKRGEDDAVAVSNAVKQLHGGKSAGKIVDKNVPEIVGVCGRYEKAQ